MQNVHLLRRMFPNKAPAIIRILVVVFGGALAIGAGLLLLL